MRFFIYVMAFLGLLGLGSWAYSENYAMRAKLSEVSDLQREIGLLRDALSTQKAEWAYLNRPDRLRELVNLNFERLGLMPMEPAQLGFAAEVAFPRVPLAEGLPGTLDLSKSVDVQGNLAPKDVGDVEESFP